MRVSSKNLFWSIKNSSEILDKVKAIKEISMRPVCLLMIFLLFTLLYLIKSFKINLLILLKELSREKALVTLHVMTEMYFLPPKNLRNIMHGHVKL